MNLNLTLPTMYSAPARQSTDAQPPEAQARAGAPGRSVDSTTITIGSRLSVVEPAHGQLLQPLLQYTSSELNYISSGGSQWSTSTTRLYEQWPDDQLVVPTGAVPRLVQHLRDSGFNVTIHDRRRNPLRVDHELLGQLSPDERLLAQAVMRDPLGLLATSSEQQRMHCLGVIGRLYPQARILVPVATAEQANQWRDGLTRYFPCVARARNSNWRDDSRIVTTTYENLWSVDPADWSIVFAPEAKAALTQQVGNLLGVMDQHLIYGCIGHSEHLSGRTALRVEAGFSAVIYRAPGGPAPVAKVMVHMAALNSSCGRLAEDALSRKRTAIWHNLQRNRQVAALASAVAASDDGVVRQYGVCLPARYTGKLYTAPNVAVLVESPEHARELMKLLPG